MTINNAMYDAGHEAAYELMGTAKSLHEVPTDEQMNDASFLAAIDMEVFECEECGWWCENCEDTGDGICEDCA